MDARSKEEDDQFAAWKSRVQKIVDLIVANGGKLPHYPDPIGYVLSTSLHLIGMRALASLAPTNHVSGDAKLYRDASRLLASIRERTSLVELVQPLFEKIGKGVTRQGIEAAANPEWKGLFAIEKVLAENVESLKPRRAKGRPVAADFIDQCCNAAEDIERETGIPILVNGRTNSIMIDIVTEFLREIPEENRRVQKPNPEIDRSDDPQRTGVAAALRDGRKVGLLS
jgi:hypothetical protein